MKSLSLIAFIGVAWTITQIGAIADTPAMPLPWVKTSERSDFLFKMVPAKWRKEGEKLVIERDAFGVAYQVTEDGEFHELWRTEGWYTFDEYRSYAWVDFKLLSERQDMESRPDTKKEVASHRDSKSHFSHY